MYNKETFKMCFCFTFYWLWF